MHDTDDTRDARSGVNSHIFLFFYIGRSVWDVQQILSKFECGQNRDFALAVKFISKKNTRGIRYSKDEDEEWQ